MSGRVRAGPRRLDHLVPQKKSLGGVGAGPRRQDQLVPKQQKFRAGYELVPGGRISSGLKKTCGEGHELVLEGRMSSYLKNMFGAGYSENLWGRVRAGPRRQD